VTDTSSKKGFMQRAAVAAALAVALTLAAPGLTRACGDKLIVFGRGVRFERLYLAKHPGAVLIFMNPDSDLPRADREFQFSAALELAGHRVDVVASRAALADALTAEPSALVLAALADARTLLSEGAVEDGPGILPILYKPTKGELAEARELSPCLGQAAKRKGHQLLEVVDEILEQFERGERPACSSPARGAS